MIVRGLAGTLLVAVALIAPQSAAAHVQVLPAVAATGDPTLFTVLVPNERDTATTKVEVAIPSGVIPFSFEAMPGWTRGETRKANGSLRSVFWRGRIGVGEFAKFSFLAGTPETSGTLRWPAVQTYADGTTVHWIGDPDSDEPAATTQVSADAPRQNAGGEGGDDGEAPPATTASEPVTTATASSSDETSTQADAASSSDSNDDTARLLGLAGLVCGVAALVLAAVALRRRSSRGDPGTG